MARELTTARTSGDGGKHPLPALPGGVKGWALPSVSVWRAWTQSKLAGWCGLQAQGFAEAVLASLGGPTSDVSWVHIEPRFTKANKNLAFELCAHANDDTSLYWTGVARTDGYPC